MTNKELLQSILQKRGFHNAENFLHNMIGIECAVICHKMTQCHIFELIFNSQPTAIDHFTQQLFRSYYQQTKEDDEWWESLLHGDEKPTEQNTRHAKLLYNFLQIYGIHSDPEEYCDGYILGFEKGKVIVALDHIHVMGKR